jgi:DNA-binding PadR family transcriptional regulator
MARLEEKEFIKPTKGYRATGHCACYRITQKGKQALKENT